MAHTPTMRVQRHTCVRHRVSGFYVFMGMLLLLLLCASVTSATVHVHDQGRPDARHPAADGDADLGPVWHWEVRLAEDHLTVLNLTEDEFINASAAEARRALYGPLASHGALRPWAAADGWDRLDGRIDSPFYLRQQNASAEPSVHEGLDTMCLDDAALDNAYFALGVAEGFMTQDTIYNHLHNTLDGPGGLIALMKEFEPEMDAWFDAHEAFLAEHITPPRVVHAPAVHLDSEANEDEDEDEDEEVRKEKSRTREYQDQTYRLVAQFKGIAYGYNLRAQQRRAMNGVGVSRVVRALRPVELSRTAFSLRSPTLPGRPRYAVPTSLDVGLRVDLIPLLNMQAEVGDIVRAILYGKAVRADARSPPTNTSDRRHAQSTTTALSAEGQHALDTQLHDLERRFPDIMLTDHCSALVKVLDDTIVVAHTTWNAYQSMTRIHKNYQLQVYTSLGLRPCVDASAPPLPANTSLNDSTLPHRRVSMSSYPGMIHSVDDFYTTQARLTVTETSYSLVDTALYAFVTPNCVLAFLRVMVANYLTGDVAALTAHEMPYSAPLASSSTRPTVDWFHWLGRFNSGTYNNEWMVLGANTDDRFVVGGSVPAGALAAAPRVALAETPGTAYDGMPPGLVVFDMSAPLFADGYWASYNIPALPALYHITGTALLKAECGAMFDHDEAPRARAFREAMPGVHSVSDVRRLMRWGPFRGDINAEVPNCTGASGPLMRHAGPVGGGGTDGNNNNNNNNNNNINININNNNNNNADARNVTDRCDPPYSSFLTIAARGDLNPEGGLERYGPCHARLGHRNHAATDLKMVHRTRHVPDRIEAAPCWETMHLVNGPPHADEWMPVGLPPSVAAALRRDYPPFRWDGVHFDPMPPLNGLPTAPYTFPVVAVTVACNPTASGEVPPSSQGTAGISWLGWLAVLTLLGAVSVVVVYYLRHRAASAAHRVMTSEEVRLLRGEETTTTSVRV